METEAEGARGHDLGTEVLFMKYSPKQYRNLSQTKKRQMKLGSSDISGGYIHNWKSKQEEKKAFSSVYKRYSGGYR